MKQLVRTLQLRDWPAISRHYQHGAMLLAAATAVLSFSGPQPRPLAAVRHRAPVPVLFDPGLALFEAQVATEALVANQLATQLTPLSGLVLYGAGLLTAVSPCCLSMLPLTTAVIAGLEQENDGLLKLRLPVAFALGLASSLALAGVVAALTGRLYGQSAGILAEALPAVIAVSMGLNLLQARPEPAQHPASSAALPRATLPPIPSLRPVAGAPLLLPVGRPSGRPAQPASGRQGLRFRRRLRARLLTMRVACVRCRALSAPAAQPPRGATPALTPPSPRHPARQARLDPGLRLAEPGPGPRRGAAPLLQPGQHQPRAPRRRAHRHDLRAQWPAQGREPVGLARDGGRAAHLRHVCGARPRLPVADHTRHMSMPHVIHLLRYERLPHCVFCTPAPSGSDSPPRSVALPLGRAVPGGYQAAYVLPLPEASAAVRTAAGALCAGRRRRSATSTHGVATAACKPTGANRVAAAALGPAQRLASRGGWRGEQPRRPRER